MKEAALTGLVARKRDSKEGCSDLARCIKCGRRGGFGIGGKGENHVSGIRKRFDVGRCPVWN